MKFVKRILFVFLFTIASFAINAQEILCNLQVNHQQVQGTDVQIFETMETALVEFINNKRWTGYDFKTEERIECSMVITITERPSTNNFKARLNIVASRPIFGTTYNTTLLNYLDENFDFEYVEFQSIEYVENQYISNISSLIAYYIYFIMALDFDTFSPNGGSQFFEKAELVVNAAQDAPYAGWNSFESQRNRYWLVENYLNQAYSDLRTFLYQYHRQGLDIMSEKTDEGRATIAQSLNLLKNINDEQPSLFAMQLLIDAKKDEIVNIFKQGKPDEKDNVIEIMKDVDPSNSSTYTEINSRN